MKIFDKILEKHTKINNYKRQSYMINEDIEIIISQEGSKVIMRGFNHKTDRFINFSTKKYKKLMDGFKSASTDLYSDGNHFYYITLGTSNNDKIVENYDLKIEELNKKIKKIEKQPDESLYKKIFNKESTIIDIFFVYDIIYI